MNAHEILKKPYSRLVIPDGDSGFFAEIVEFSGCFAVGETIEQALKELGQIAVDWLAAAQSQGQKIPEPMGSLDYSGRLVVRMPKGLHQRAAFMAQRENVSLNQFIVTCISEQIGMKAAPQYQMAQIVISANFSASSGVGSPWAQFHIPQATQPQQLMTTNAPYFSNNPVTRGVQHARS